MSMEYKPLIQLANDWESCRKIFKQVFPAPLSKMDRVFTDEWAVQIEGDNGDMNGDYARLELHFDGSVHCCIERHGEQHENIGSLFQFVDLIRSLGYSA